MISNNYEKPQWAQQFNIDPSTWQALCQQADREKATPLDLALDMGLLNENKLLKWDREISKLATLKAIFFNGEPPFELWKDQNYEKCRTHACMPVALWEGVVIWAKLSSEVTGFESENPGGVWVLAPWSGMKRWFQEWQTKNSVQANGENHVTDGELPAGLNLQSENLNLTQTQTQTSTKTFIPDKFKMNIPDPNEEKESDDKSLDLKLDFSLPVDSVKEPTITKIDPDAMPAGLGAQAKDVMVDFSNIGVSDGHDDPTPEMKPEPKTETTPAKKLGHIAKGEDGAQVLELEFDTGVLHVSEVQMASKEEAPAKVSEPSHPEPVFDMNAEISLGEVSLVNITNSGVTSTNSGPVPQPGMAPPTEHLSVIIPEPARKPKPTESAYNLDISVAELNMVTPPPLQRMTPPPPKLTPPPIPGQSQRGVRNKMVPPPLPSMSPIPQELARTFPPVNPVSPMQVSADVATIPLDQLEPRLKHATNQDALAQVLMGVWQNHFDKIMILLFQNENLLIWWHNNRWKNTAAKGEQIPVDTPSIFKIVVDTGHPYHGYVMPGEVNDLFFQKTNGGDYPEHVTVIPVVAGNRVVAMLLGTCSRDTGKNLVLARLEENAHTFSNGLVKLMTPHQKAG